MAATQTIMSNNDNQMAAFGPVTPEQEAAKSQVCVTYLLSSISCFEILISQNFHYIKNENYELFFLEKLSKNVQLHYKNRRGKFVCCFLLHLTPEKKIGVIKVARCKKLCQISSGSKIYNNILL